MTRMIAELRQARGAAGAPEEQADAAAAVAGADEAATKADLAVLRSDLAELKAWLGGRILAAVGVVAAIQALAVAVLIAVLG